MDIKPTFVAVDKEENANAVDENGDQILYRMQIDYATLGEGEFDFDIEYTDIASNKNDAVNMKLTLDTENSSPTTITVKWKEIFSSWYGRHNLSW